MNSLHQNKTRLTMRILLILLLGVTSFTLVGQDFSTRRFAITAKAPAFNWMSSSNSDLSGVGLNLGYSVGLQVEFPFKENIYLIGGLQFSGNNGGSIRYDLGGNFWPRARLINPAYNDGAKPLPDRTVLKYSINTLDIPIGLKFYTNYRDNTRYYFEVPILGFHILTKSRGAINPPGMPSTRDEIIREETRNLVLSLGGGFGICYDIGFGEVFAGLHYQSAITNVSRNNGKFASELGSGFRTIDMDARHMMQQIAIKMGIAF
jgi:hypothetical protein